MKKPLWFTFTFFIILPAITLAMKTTTDRTPSQVLELFDQRIKNFINTAQEYDNGKRYNVADSLDFDAPSGEKRNFTSYYANYTIWDGVSSKDKLSSKTLCYGLCYLLKNGNQELFQSSKFKSLCTNLEKMKTFFQVDSYDKNWIAAICKKRPILTASNKSSVHPK